MSIAVEARQHIVAAVEQADNSTEEIEEVSTSPSPVQQALIDRGYGMFIHFGMNTFIQQEWSDGTALPTAYEPTQLNPDQWIKVARDAGFRYVILVTKHHDGFCLWDSKYTDYDVASSSVPDDVVKGVADACRKYGLQLGIYYSLWDRHEPTYLGEGKKFGKYVDFMENQLRELLTNYGPVCELWLDGGWDKPASMWQMPRLYKLVKKLQPNCAFAVNNAVTHTTDFDSEWHWQDMAVPDDMVRDNTLRMRYWPVDFRLQDPRMANWYDAKQYLRDGKSYYLPFEHTICISKAWNWFQKDAPSLVRDYDELEQLFYWCTRNDNALVVNLPPDRRGLIRENEANAIIELAQRLGIEQGKPLPTQSASIALGSTVEASSVWKNSPDYAASKVVDGGMTTRWASEVLTPELIIDLDPNKEFNQIAIFEYMDEVRAADGFSSGRKNRIESYEVDIWQNNQWEAIYVSDLAMGDCKVIRLPQHYATSKLRLKVLRASNFPSINEILVVDTSK